MQESIPVPVPVHVMDKQESFSPTPLLPRLDRLDRLLQLLEEKHNININISSSGRHNICKTTVEKEKVGDVQKSLSSALEEVQHKGTLVQRLAMLETRVLQLSLAIDEGDASKSSPSSVAGYEKLDYAYDASPKEKHQDLHHSVCELREKYEQFVGSRDWRNTRHKDGDTDSTKWQKTKQEVATMV